MSEITTSHKLTPEQITNWRKTMLNIVGPVAFVLSDDDIQAFRDKMQEAANKLPEAEETEAK